MIGKMDATSTCPIVILQVCGGEKDVIMGVGISECLELPTDNDGF